MVFTRLQDIDELHATLCMDGLGPTEDGWGAAAAQKSSLGGPLARFSSTLKLLANTLHCSPAAKRRAIDRGFAAVLEPVWGLCALSDRAMRRLLEVVCNLVAQCPEAAKSLALPASNRHSLVVAAADLGTRMLSNRARLSLRRPLFDLLTTLAATSECRSVMWKEGLFDECISRLPVAKHVRD